MGLMRWIKWVRWGGNEAVEVEIFMPSRSHGLGPQVSVGYPRGARLLPGFLSDTRKLTRIGFSVC